MIAGQTGIEFLRRHMCADWSELSADDAQENEHSLRKGFRVLRAYRTSAGQNLDHHRSSSQFDDYSLTRRILKPGQRLRRECVALAPFSNAAV